MSLYQDWKDLADNASGNDPATNKMWEEYFDQEKKIYAQLLEHPDEAVSGTVVELAKQYGITTLKMTGFLDGIQESLVAPNPLEELTEDSVVSLGFDKAKLYRNMVAAKADWLYELPQWDAIFDEKQRKALFREQKLSTTIVKQEKVYPNDPCPCGSGKKHKKCCGKAG
ncbi:MAG: SEC-C domain-containing protein [Clostridium sp.]|jgi:uncharacterized protein YecA (UPF0149 family)|nr:SEC-C domain-containing protein [Clostridium sp.]